MTTNINTVVVRTSTPTKIPSIVIIGDDDVDDIGFAAYSFF